MFLLLLWCQIDITVSIQKIIFDQNIFIKNWVAIFIWDPVVPGADIRSLIVGFARLSSYSCIWSWKNFLINTHAGGLSLWRPEAGNSNLWETVWLNRLHIFHNYPQIYQKNLKKDSWSWKNFVLGARFATLHTFIIWCLYASLTKKSSSSFLVKKCQNMALKFNILQRDHPQA